MRAGSGLTEMLPELEELEEKTLPQFSQIN
jgi:hypothetical protein